MVIFIPNSSQSSQLIYLRATYRRIGDRSENPETPIKKVLDIGTATGHPLKSIISKFKDA
jgi:hypothetical protein